LKTNLILWIIYTAFYFHVLVSQYLVD